MKIHPYSNIALSLVIGLFACNPGEHGKSTDNADEKALVVDQTTHDCFLFTEEQSPIMSGKDTLAKLIDSTYLSMDINGSTVSGKFENIPAEKDAAIGTYNGTVGENGFINAVYHYTQEGDEYNEFIQIMVTGIMGHIRFVQDTTIKHGDPSAGNWLMLPKTDCPK